MSDNPPVPWDLEDFDYVRAGLADYVVEELEPSALWHLTFLATTPEEFFAGIQAAVELQDIVRDYYDTEREPDDYLFEEADDTGIEIHIFLDEDDDEDDDDY